MTARVAVVCPTRRVAALDPAGAAVHLRGIAEGFVQAGATTELWVARAGRGGDSARVPAPAGLTLREARRGRLPGFLRKHRAWDEAADAAALARQARRWARALRPDLVYERFALFASVGARLRHPGCPWVLEVNAPVAWEAVWFEGLQPDPALIRWEERTLRAADRVVVVSEPLADLVRRRGVHPDRIDLEPNGVARLPLTTSADPGPDAPFVLGYEGTFKPWQGLPAALPDLRCLAAQVAPRPLVVELWGDGPDRAALSEAGDLDLRFRGWGTPDRATWHAAWIPEGPWPPAGPALAEPPPARYFSPLKQAEAAAAGLPLFRRGRLEPPGPAPATWEQIADRILARSSASL